jgi:hypothetical protein
MSWAGDGDMHCVTQCGGAHSAATCGIIYIYYVCYSTAWRATSGRWAYPGGRRTYNMLTLWGMEDTEEEAVTWELGYIKFQVG